MFRLVFFFFVPHFLFEVHTYVHCDDKKMKSFGNCRKNEFSKDVIMKKNECEITENLIKKNHFALSRKHTKKVSFKIVR